MASKDLYQDDPFAWVALAASSDQARPTLGCVEVSNGGRTLVATDGHRLHLVELEQSSGLADGLYVAKTRARSPEGTFPNWRTVMPEQREVRELTTGLELSAVLAGAVAADKVATSGKRRGWNQIHSAYLVTLLSSNEIKHCALNPAYVVDALKGLEMRYGATTVTLNIGTELQPLELRAELGGAFGTRRALVMPVRTSGERSDRFHLDEFIAQPASAQSAA